MVNLLFISSNSKIATIKTALQPLLKLKIDSVGDFDYGLKDVFEKRPAIVFIQDQIAGVTGESVARHIQMLLGSGAPIFILMHDGNLKVTPIKGLYEYLIDLSYSETKVLANIQSTLALVLGPQWQKIYVPPRANISVVRSAWAVPEEDRDIADQMVNDLVSDLGKVTHSFNNNSPFSDSGIPESSTEEPLPVDESPHDQLDGILAAAASERNNMGAVPAAESVLGVKNVPVTPESASTSDKPAPAATSHHVSTSRADGGAAIPDTSLTAHTVLPKNGSSATDPIRIDMPEISPSVPISPAEFSLGRESASPEIAAEKILMEMEGYYCSKQNTYRRIKIAVALLIVCAVLGYWYLLKQNAHLPELRSAGTAVAPSSIVQQPMSAVQKNANTTEPSVIPSSGNDQMFASQKPGWERYVGPDFEMRMYRLGGKLKAVQVLAAKGHVISESRLKTILIELTGTDVFKITSHEQKHGFDVAHATVERKADLLIYRKKSAVHAFVVSLD